MREVRCHSTAAASLDPVNLADPTGEILPVLLGIWAVVEVGLAIYDVNDVATTVWDEDAQGG